MVISKTHLLLVVLLPLLGSFIAGLFGFGFSQAEIDIIARRNPALLMGLDV